MPTKKPGDLATKFWKEWVEADGLKRQEMLKTRVDKLFHGEREMLREMITMVLYDYISDLEQYLTSTNKVKAN